MKKTQIATRLIFLAFGLGISSWAPMVPFAKERLELDDAQLGMLLFIFGIGALGTMPLTGWLVHQYGSRCMTILSGFFVAALLPFLAISSTLFSLSVILFLFGAGTGLMNVSINAQAVAVESKSPTPVMSGFHCLFSTGGLLGALMITALLEFNFPLPFCAFVISCIMSLLLIFQWKHLLHVEERQTKGPKEKFNLSLPNGNILFLGVICFIAFISEGSMLDWSAEFLRSSKDYDPSIAGIGYAVFSISMAIGRLFGDRLIKRYTQLKVFQTGSILAAFGFALVVFPTIYHGELLGFCFIGLGASNIVPILFSAAGRISATKAGFALTIVTTIGYGGGLIGPAFIGFLAEATSLSIALASLSACLLGVAASGKLALSIPVEQPVLS